MAENWCIISVTTYFSFVYKILKHRKEYLKNGGREKAHSKRIERHKNPIVRAHINAWARERLRNPHHKIRSRLSARANSALKGKRKQKRTIEMLGCSFEQFKNHLTSQFQDGMTLENHGRGHKNQPPKWQIDHIIPCSAYDLSDPEEQLKCFNWQKSKSSGIGKSL